MKTRRVVEVQLHRCWPLKVSDELGSWQLYPDVKSPQLNTEYNMVGKRIVINRFMNSRDVK
jgi:hypothetical protein